MSRVQTLKQRPRRGRARLNGPTQPPRPVLPQAALSFIGTTAVVRLASSAQVAAVFYDGVALPAEEWGESAEGDIQIACPPTAFDALPHTLRLQWLDPGLSPTDLTFQSQYHGNIETIGEDAVRGWLFDALRPESALTLDVATGAGTRRVRTTESRPELREKYPAVIGGGFTATLPPRPAHGQPDLVTITVEGTGYQPFDPVLRGVTLPAAIAAATAAAQSFDSSITGLLFGTVVLPLLAEAAKNATLPQTLGLPSRRCLPRPTLPTLDVIVPVYRGKTETLSCLASVLYGNNKVRHRVVVIDDCSPEPELSDALKAMAADGRIQYVRNDRTLGFVETVNRGMALSSDTDVVLLNADTVAPPGFLDRLYRAAYSDTAIATVTPLSNNATVYSLPAPPGSSEDPWGMTVDAIDALCQKENARIVRDIPTAHGFCMFIKRAALDDIGLFDAARFGTGYGEENDFSLRAILRGWRNVCAADVYVHHVGAVSFTTSAAREVQWAANVRAVTERFPFYETLVEDFLRTDPLHDVRNNIQKAIWRQHPRIVVFITLSLEGGCARHSSDMMARLTDEGYLVLALTANGDSVETSALTLRRAGTNEMLRYPPCAPLEEVLSDILDLAPRFIHIQHLIDLPDGLAEFVRDCGIPYVITLHDFFYACPKVTLLDAGVSYCGMPPATKCTQCVRQGPIHAQIHPSLTRFAEKGNVWRAKWEGLLRDAVQVIAPSHDTAARYAQLFPGLTATVRPHFAPRNLRLPTAHAVRPADSSIRVALPGAIGPQKGVHLLIDLARHCSRWHDDIIFVIVGHSDREEQLSRYDNIIVRGGYDPADAVVALAAANCHVALLLNVFPETFSYTLSESLQAGLVPVAFDFGAIGERMRALGVGVLVPPGAGPEQLVSAIRQAAQLRVDVPAAALYAQYRLLMSDYYAPPLTDLAESVPPPDRPRVIGRPRGRHEDGWCDGLVRLHLWSGHLLTRIAFGLWVPEEGRFQAVEITCNGRKLMRGFIDPGEVRRLVCVLPDGGLRRMDITLRFDFVFRLRPPDVRSCAAILASISVSEGRGWHMIDLPVTEGTATDVAARSIRAA